MDVCMMDVCGMDMDIDLLIQTDHHNSWPASPFPPSPPQTPSSTSMGQNRRPTSTAPSVFARPKHTSPLSNGSSTPPEALRLFLSLIPPALVAQDKAAFAILFNTTCTVFSSLPIQLLRHSILSLPPGALRPIVAAALTDDWPGLNEAVSCYLDYVATCDPAIASFAAGELELAPLTSWFNALFAFVNALNSAFGTPRGGVLALVVRGTLKDLVDVGVACDRFTRDNTHPHLHRMLETISRSFSASVAERAMTIGGVLKLGKRAVALDVANTLFRVYAHLREYRLMGTVLDNLTNAGIPLSTANFSKATLVTFNWYAGTHNLHSEHFLLARDHLTVAYELLHPSFVATRHRILIPLLAVSAILGYTAPPAVFARPEAQGLWALFNPLYYALRKGDFRAFRCALGDADPAGRGGVEDTRWRRAFWQRHRLYYVLRHRCQPLLWRALIRKVWTLTPVAAGGAGGVTGAGGAGGGAGMPKVAIADVAACARALGEDVSDVDVEAMALGCLEQGLIRGYIAPMQAGAYVVLTKGGGKFPSVASLWRQARWQRPVEEVAAGGGRVLRLKGVRGVGG